MDLINQWGIIFMVIIMIPNIIFAYSHPEGFDNLYHHRFIEICEQIGRFGCFLTMIINIPYTCQGWLINGTKDIYIIMNMIFISLYCLTWIVFEKGMMKALVLSTLPSCIFLGSGILMQSLLLIVFSLIFAPCHIWISYRNQIKTLEINKIKEKMNE